MTCLGVNVFDPTGTLIPAEARGVNFRRVLQYQTLDAFNTDYQGLELGVVKRMSSRWSGRASYSLSRGRDVNVITGNANTIWDRRVNDDYGVTSGLNPRADYGLFEPGQPARVHGRRQLGRRARAGRRGDLRVLQRQSGE